MTEPRGPARRGAGGLSAVARVLAAAGFAGGVLWAASAGRLPGWAAWAVGGLSVAGFVLHGWDKWRAGRGGRRVPEATLHLVSVLGGWPGALLGRHLFRHKTRKTSYRLAFWACAAVNAAAAGWWAWVAG